MLQSHERYWEQSPSLFISNTRCGLQYWTFYEFFSTLYTYFHISQLKFCEINLPRKFILVRVALWGGGRRSTAVLFFCDHILTPERNPSSVCSAFRARAKQWIQLCSMNFTDCFNECYRPFIEPLIEAWLRRAKQQNDVLDQNYRKMSNMPNQKLIWYRYKSKLRHFGVFLQSSPMFTEPFAFYFASPL